MEPVRRHLPQVIHVNRDACVNCHACIALCPVKTCNDGSGAYVNLNADTCIACGRCLTACTHGARYLSDDFPRFLEDLAGHERMIALVAPSAVANFPDQYLHLNGWLKSLGIAAVFDVAVGAELCAESYADLLRRGAAKMVIAQPCAAIVTYIQVHMPELLPYLAPVDSPMVHTMKMVRRRFPRYGDHKIAVISPCPAKKREFDETGYGDYCVTYSSIRDHLEADGVDLKSFPAENFDAPSPDAAVLLPMPGGLAQTLERLLPEVRERTRTIQGQQSVYQYLATLPETLRTNPDSLPLLIDCLNCEYGCNCGPGSLQRDQAVDAAEHRIRKRHRELREQHDNGQPENRTAQFEPAPDPHWVEGAYFRTYLDLSANNTMRLPSDEQRKVILAAMHKHSEKDLYNCCSCGYGSCYDMAVAIHNGWNRPENCHHFLAKETERYQQNISHYQEHLEKLVSGRTDQLTRTNILLRQEVAERVRAEKELEDSRRQLREIILGSPIPQFVIDKEHRVVYWNKALENSTSVKAEQVLGTTDHWKAFYTDERPCLADLLVDGNVEAIVRRFGEKCHQTSAVTEAYEGIDFFPELGTEGKWLYFTAAVIRDAKGAVIGALESVKDVTDHRLAQIRLARSQQAAEHANRAKSEFLANMSHEIRAPMTAILGYTKHLIEAQETEQSPKFRAQALEVILRNGEHLLELINGILDLSKIEAGKLRIERSPCSPRQLVGDVVSLMQVRADEKHLQFEPQFIGPLPDAIDTDPLQLRQVLVNLVGNAIKFTDQGKVTILVKLVSGDGRPGMQFDVTDTGIGMTQEQMGLLFQPFSQVDTSASRRYGGTGLGLAICHRLVEALGGSIAVTSTPGRGSTFSFTIDARPSVSTPMTELTPNHEAKPGPQSSSPVSQQGIRHARLLLAEDSPDIRELAVLLLKSAGADVTAVENGQLAVERAWASWQEGRPFDVVLMDMQMPVMDGYTATRELRQRGYSRPIIALTAHAMTEDRQKCLNAGCEDHISKPIEVDRMVATIARFMTTASTTGAIPQSDVTAGNCTGNENILRSQHADHPIIGRILGEFVAGLEPRVAAMRAALGEGQVDELRRIAHQFKGAAGSYGYPSLADTLATLEMDTQCGRTDSAAMLLERIAAMSLAAINGWKTPALT